MDLQEKSINSIVSLAWFYYNGLFWMQQKDSAHPFKNKISFLNLIKIWKGKHLEVEKFEKCHRDNTGIDCVCS